MIYSNAPGMVPAMVPKLDLTYRPVIAPPPWPGLTTTRQRGRGAGAFSGKVESGFPQKMRPTKKACVEPIESTVLSFRGAPKMRVGNS